MCAHIKVAFQSFAISVMLAIAGSIFQGFGVKVHSTCEKCVFKAISFQSNELIVSLRGVQVQFIHYKIDISAFQADLSASMWIFKLSK